MKLSTGIDFVEQVINVAMEVEIEKRNDKSNISDNGEITANN